MLSLFFASNGSRVVEASVRLLGLIRYLFPAKLETCRDIHISSVKKYFSGHKYNGEVGQLYPQPIPEGDTPLQIIIRILNGVSGFSHYQKDLKLIFMSMLMMANRSKHFFPQKGIKFLKKDFIGEDLYTISTPKMTSKQPSFYKTGS